MLFVVFLQWFGVLWFTYVALADRTSRTKFDTYQTSYKPQPSFSYTYRGPCHDQCIKESGCSGTGPSHCNQCRRFKDATSKVCVESCNSQTQFVENEECKMCHEECNGCNGPTEFDCTKCKHFVNGPFDECVSECDTNQYSENRSCKYCSPSCRHQGCHGPKELEGPDGCKSCSMPLIKMHFVTHNFNCSRRGCLELEKCLTLNTSCPDGYYKHQCPENARGEFALFAGNQICIRCHQFCSKCTAYGFNKKVCQECKGHENCLCPAGYYYDSKENIWNATHCKPCRLGCKECTKITTCVGCEVDYYRVYDDDDVPNKNGSYTCTVMCPPDKPFLLQDAPNLRYCSSENTSSLLECNTDQFADGEECKECHEECLGCTGPTEFECSECRNYFNELLVSSKRCVAKCHDLEYPLNKSCRPCSSYCLPQGCNGPVEFESPNGCKSCDRPLIVNYFDILDFNCSEIACFNLQDCFKSSDTCPEGYFEERIPTNIQGHFLTIAGKLVCIRCHKYCSKCTGYGFNNEVCEECKEYKDCSCPTGYFYDQKVQDSGESECRLCSEGCTECTGFEECAGCRYDYFRVFGKGYPSQNGSYRCSRVCPPDQPFPNVQHEKYQNYCSPLYDSLLSNNNPVIYSVIIIVVCISSFATVFLMFYIRIRTQNDHYKRQINVDKVLEECEEPLESTNITPNRAKLRIIKDSDVQKTAVLGSGAFGVVYKGVLFLEKDIGYIEVAIKVLNPQNNETSTKELLEEARIMSCVNHPNLLRLLAVSVTSDVMLVTQFMPLGVLRQYVQRHNRELKANTLLRWCSQIAQAMAYLEEHRLLHRDLAARNVLVQTINRVKVTDFGLTRALKIDQEIYVSRGGKLPIKWLALESLSQGIFTHKSDVWAFGITVWEILTFAEEPYEVTTITDLKSLLERGERLRQPDSCTVDMYAVLATCWAEDAEARPSFKYLVETFSQMVREPQRYIILTGADDGQRIPEHEHRLNNYAEIGQAGILEGGELLNENNHSYENIVLE